MPALCPLLVLYIVVKVILSGTTRYMTYPYFMLGQVMINFTCMWCLLKSQKLYVDYGSRGLINTALWYNWNNYGTKSTGINLSHDEMNLNCGQIENKTAVSWIWWWRTSMSLKSSYMGNWYHVNAISLYLFNEENITWIKARQSVCCCWVCSVYVG